jgi:hypothetical protein
LRRNEDEGLTEREREALRRLLESEEGRRVIQETLDEGAAGAPSSGGRSSDSRANAGGAIGRGR